MAPIEVEFCWLQGTAPEGISLPAYQTDGSAGMDVRAHLEGKLVMQPGEIAMISTGFAIAVPEGYEVQVRPRSGLAIKHGVTVVNAPGTIDSDYRGEVKIGLINLGSVDYTISSGDRIAQLVVAPVSRAVLRVTAKLDDTLRGSGGFGHTGHQ